MPSRCMLRAVWTFVVCVILWGVARAADLDLPPPGSCTVVVLPDSQGYRGQHTKATPQSTAPLADPVITFDPTQKELVERTTFVPARTEHQFLLDYPMTPAPRPATSAP